MKTAQLTRRIALVAGGIAIVGMGSLTACSSTKEKEAPATSSTSSATSSAPSLSSTEKVITQKPIPSLEDRGSMDSHGCPPGQYKTNGVCG